MDKTELRDRIKATFLLIAIGDALGMPVEIMTPEKITKQYGKITGYVDPPKDHKWHGDKMKAGMWTDDMQLTMAITKSLIRCGKVDMDDIARSHVAALEESISGWGGNTTTAIKNIQLGIHWSKAGIIGAAGNGISMKIAPLGLLLAIEQLKANSMYDKDVAFRSLEEAIVKISTMTHQSRMAIASGLAQAWAVIASALLLEKNFAEYFLQTVIGACRLGENVACQDNLTEKLSERMEHLLVTKNYEKMSLEEVIKEYGGKGKDRFYVLNSLTLSYALFLRNPNSIETLFDVVNAGGDTDTNASMVGALLGARNGLEILAQHQYLVDGLWRKDEIIEIAEQFCDTFIL